MQQGADSEMRGCIIKKKKCILLGVAELMNEREEGVVCKLSFVITNICIVALKNLSMEI